MKYKRPTNTEKKTQVDEAGPTKRAYRKVLRAEAEQATGEAILQAALTAFSRQPFDRVTLQGIADESGVTVQTVIRRFGSKEELFATLVERETPRVLATREVSEDAGLDTALAALLRHYEEDGDMILNFVAQEHVVEPLRGIVEQGRHVHREWVERHCRDLLAVQSDARRELVLHAAIVATDLSTWKLLRRDLGLAPTEVAAVMSELLHALKER